GRPYPDYGEHAHSALLRLHARRYPARGRRESPGRNRGQRTPCCSTSNRHSAASLHRRSISLIRTRPAAHITPRYMEDFVKAYITLIRVGVDDLERAVRFYRDGLGLKTEGIIGQEFEYGAVAFFDMQPGLRLALWPRESLAHDSGLQAGQPSATEFCLAH